jgi:hypothetical protein
LLPSLAPGRVVRKDLQRARRIIAKRGSTGLFRALARGVALPAAALVPVVKMLEEHCCLNGDLA